MARHATDAVIWTDLREHPAVQAWRELRPERTLPEEIEILKNKYKNLTVYRLAGVGPRGSSVIAKRCKRENALIERTIYEEIIPHLPVSTARYYGFVEESESKFCWQFLEDVGEERYSPNIEEHRALAARWLGHMHTFAARVGQAPTLPDQGASWYRKRLQSVRGNILRRLANHALNAEHVEILQTVVSQMDVLELRWNELEKCCAGIPSTLVHNDFVPKNIRIRNTPSGMVLLPFDWDVAGWGVPATDVAELDVGVYWSVVRDHWPSLDLPAIRRLATAGRIFSLLSAFYWASSRLEEKWVSKKMSNIQVYRTRMSHGIEAIQGGVGHLAFYGYQS